MRRCSLAQSKYSAMNVWALRQRRNGIIWKNKTKPPIDVVNQATQLVEDWNLQRRMTEPAHPSKLISAFLCISNPPLSDLQARPPRLDSSTLQLFFIFIFFLSMHYPSSDITCDTNSKVIFLSISHVPLYGTVPPEIGLLKNLVNLILTVNKFTGKVPIQMSNLTHLKFINISSKNFVEDFPEGSLPELKNLTLINLFRNHFAGLIPYLVSELPKLKILQIWENNFTFELPENLGRSKKIMQLDVTRNHLTRMMSRDLYRGGRLKTLILMGGEGGGEGEREVRRMRDKRIFADEMTKMPPLTAHLWMEVVFTLAHYFKSPSIILEWASQSERPFHLCGPDESCLVDHSIAAAQKDRLELGQNAST
ncbi:hypothetical protein LguiB_025122 [Lonicera macranthoides]